MVAPHKSPTRPTVPVPFPAAMLLQPRRAKSPSKSVGRKATRPRHRACVPPPPPCTCRPCGMRAVSWWLTSRLSTATLESCTTREFWLGLVTCHTPMLLPLHATWEERSGVGVMCRDVQAGVAWFCRTLLTVCDACGDCQCMGYPRMPAAATSYESLACSMCFYTAVPRSMLMHGLHAL